MIQEYRETFFISDTIAKSLDMLQNTFEVDQINIEVVLDEKLKYFGNFEQLFEVVLSILKTPKKLFYSIILKKNY